jgi:hypothetical protein
VEFFFFFSLVFVGISMHKCLMGHKNFSLTVKLLSLNTDMEDTINAKLRNGNAETGQRHICTIDVDLSAKMDFSPHINRVTSSAMRVLGFIRRFSNDFREFSVLKLFYCTLVRLHLEYCSIVWSPYTADNIARIKSQ